jgi:RNA polymerase sigma factor (sigma-70 family)
MRLLDWDEYIRAYKLPRRQRVLDGTGNMHPVDDEPDIDDWRERPILGATELWTGGQGCPTIKDYLDEGLVLDDDEIKPPEKNLTAEEQEQLEQQMLILSERERMVLKLRCEDGLSLREIGKMIMVTSERTRCILARAYSKYKRYAERTCR